MWTSRSFVVRGWNEVYDEVAVFSVNDDDDGREGGVDEERGEFMIDVFDVVDVILQCL